MKPLVFISFVFFLSFNAHAQNKTLGVGTATPNPNVALHVESPTTNQGMLIPRLTTSQRNSLGSTLNNSTDVGIILFDTDIRALAIWNGTAWDIGSKAGAPINIINTSATGSAAVISTNNTSNDSPALLATTNGGPGGSFNAPAILGMTNTAGSAIIGKATGGSSNAIHGISDPSTNAGSYAVIGQNDGLGNAGVFMISNASNIQSALRSATSGEGSAGEFEISNPANASPVINILSNGTGNAITANKPIQATSFIGSGSGLTGLSGGLSNDNTPYGAVALFNLSSGIQNTAIGAGALFHNTVGMDNTALGRATLFANIGGSGNTGVGSNSLIANTSGASNTAVGYGSLDLNTTGNDNVAVGRQALNSNVAGNSNTAVGYQALMDNASGSGNTAIGYNANVSVSNLTNATAIGNGAIVNSSNKVRIGDGSVTVIEGQVAFTAASDKRLKTNIQNLREGLDFIMKLKPVSYYMKNQEGAKLNWGFIAQDIEALVGTGNSILTISGNDERTLGLRYTDFVAPLVKAVQEQQTVIENLKIENEKAVTVNENQTQEIALLKKQMETIIQTIGAEAKKN